MKTDSAPDIAGQGVVNPIGTALSMAMMLRYSLNLPAEAQAVDDVVRAPRRRAICHRCRAVQGSEVGVERLKRQERGVGVFI